MCIFACLRASLYLGFMSVCVCVCNGVVQPFEAITKGPNESFVHVSGVSDDFGRDAADKTLSTELGGRTKGKQLCLTLSLSLSPTLLLYLSLPFYVPLSLNPPFFCLSVRPLYLPHFLNSVNDSG